MTLAHLVRERNWSELEEAWTELILGEAPIEPALAAVDVAAKRKEIPRCLPLVREHAEMLLASSRPAEAAELLGHTMLAGGSPGELAKPLFHAAQAAWGDHESWDAYVEIADFRDNVPDMRAAWRTLKKLLALAEGRVLYHAKGWGLARIESLDPTEREADVRFVTGRRDRFPFKTAVEIFEFLDSEDLRCLVVTDPSELQRLVTKEPLEVLRWALRKHGGRANQPAIKLTVGTLGVDGSRFTAWWRKAKKLAETSEWFEVSGPPSRAQVRMLHEAEDPVEGIRRQLERSKSLGEALRRTRELASGAAAEPAVMEAALATVEKLVRQDGHDLSEQLATWLFLRERRGETPALLAETLRLAADEPPPPDPWRAPALWSVFQSVNGLRDQERCIELVQEVLGDDWLDAAAEHLPHAAPGMVRGLVDALASAGRTDELVAHYARLLVRPQRNPSLLVHLAAKIETGEDVDPLPPRLQRAQCLLQLAVHLNRGGTSDPISTRSRSRLAEVLRSGSPPLLARLLAGQGVETLRGLARMLEAGVGREIDRLFTRIAISVSPDVFRGDERPFWETGGIWTTRAGLARREEELRILKEEKIPENAEAIGKAASYGDLSENSEWEAAIEDQRNLTNRAQALESEIADARLLENAALPPDTVAPGTLVRYRDVGEGAEHEIELVGPWDVDREGQVSYRSPLGKGLLGRHPGDAVEVELPGGSVRITVLAVEPLALAT